MTERIGIEFPYSQRIKRPYGSWQNQSMDNPLYPSATEINFDLEAEEWQELSSTRKFRQ